MSRAQKEEVGHRDERMISKPKRLDMPSWVAFAAGVGIWKLVSWGLPTRGSSQVDAQAQLAPKEVAAVAQGPWGGKGGSEWYDGRGDIVDITLNYNKNAVIRMQVNYEQSGARFQGVPHGGHGGESAKMTLKYPNEYLKQVMGTYALDPTYGTDMVTSLTFITNKQTYGPYGVPRGQRFQSPPTGVVGFYGRSGVALDQLGVLTKYFGPLSKLRTNI